MQQNVFISYRQADSSESAKRLYQALQSALPAGIEIFFDVADVDPGGRIPDKLRNALEQSKVVLVVIGLKWLSIGRERFESDNDLVRFELEYGLSLRRICVLPVLVDGATMPPVTELPGRLKSFVHNEAVAVQPDEFDAGVAVIADKIKAWLRPSIRIGSHRDVALLNWDYVELLRRLILFDLEAMEILKSDESAGGDAHALAVHPFDPALAVSAQARTFFDEMRRKDRVPLAATSRGAPYRAKISVGGGVPPYRFMLDDSALPAGLSLDDSTGKITGRPRNGGECTFTVKVTDAAGNAARRRFTINGDEGTPEDWARVFQDFPDTWRMVLDRNDDILGYWHVAPLHDRYLDGVKSGTFRAGEVTHDKLKLFHMFPGTYDVFFVIVALKGEYRIGEQSAASAATEHRATNVTVREINDVHRKLFDSFFDALEELARRDVFVRELIADVWTELGKRFFEHFGMEEVDPCPREDLVAVCVGPIERILGKHAQRYPHLIERYREQMEGWNQDIFDKAAGRWARKLQAWAGGVPLFGSGAERQSGS
jgi:putative Ig domain-containing protein/TIR domain-containing protein